MASLGSIGQRSPREARLKLAGDYEGLEVNLTYRPDAVGFDEDDLPDAEDIEQDGKFFRYMAAVVVSWDVEGPFHKDVWIDGQVQSVEVLPAGPVEPTPENLRLIGAPGLSAIHQALLDHTLGNRKRKPKR